MEHRLKLLLSAILLISSQIGHAQLLTLDWTFSTKEKVLASPVTSKSVIYLGSQNGIFYALDLGSGKEIWHFETGGNIQSKALLLDKAVFFESANIFYLLDTETGSEIWRYDTQMTPFNFRYKEQEWPYKIDPFDDKRSSAIWHEGVIYVGSGNGQLYGFDAKTGKLVLELSAEEKAPIRSTPLINNGRLYFGDWNGLVYCYLLDEERMRWKKKTYRGEKPYETFGGVVSEFVSYKGLLYLGARNPMMNILLEETGEKEWTYTDGEGGWMIGDPVIYRDTLYIGGSDNLSMYAFGTETGKPLWRHNGGKNIYTKPIVTEDWLIYSCGNGYNPNDTGKIYVLDRITGKEIGSYETSNGIFSSPILMGNKIVFGCYDGNIYSVKIDRP